MSKRICRLGHDARHAVPFFPLFGGLTTRSGVARTLQKHGLTEVSMGANEFQVFSDGEIGQMHVLAHRLADEARYELGHRFLGDWLEGRKGTDSDLVHMHWHMGVFELALEEWTAAYARFNEFILPAVELGEAATDAPAMLWRLRLNAPRPVPLPWEVARKYALESLESEADDFTVLHDLLALAGAGDVPNLDRWLHDQPPYGGAGPKVLPQLGRGLRAFANEDYRHAATLLRVGMPHLASIGGSDAQRHLFHQITDFAANPHR
jgi:hypothetical protein